METFLPRRHVMRGDLGMMNGRTPSGNMRFRTAQINCRELNKGWRNTSVDVGADEKFGREIILPKNQNYRYFSALSGIYVFWEENSVKYVHILRYFVTLFLHFRISFKCISQLYRLRLYLLRYIVTRWNVTRRRRRYLHSKITRVKLKPEWVHWCQTPFRVNDDPEISQLDAEYDPELGQSDSIICQVCRKLTKFRVTEYDPNGLFSGSQSDPGVLECTDIGLISLYITQLSVLYVVVSW